MNQILISRKLIGVALVSLLGFVTVQADAAPGRYFRPLQARIQKAKARVTKPLQKIYKPLQRKIQKGKALLKIKSQRALIKAANANRKNFSTWDATRSQNLAQKGISSSPYTNGFGGSQKRTLLGKVHTSKYIRDGKMTITDTHSNLLGKSVGVRTKVYTSTGNPSRPWKLQAINKTGSFGSRNWTKSAPKRATAPRRGNATNTRRKKTAKKVVKKAQAPRRRMPVVSGSRLKALGNLLTVQGKPPITAQVQYPVRQVHRDYRAAILSGLTNAPKRTDKRTDGHYFQTFKVPALGDTLQGKAPRTISITRRDATMAASMYSPRYVVKVKAKGKKTVRVELTNKEFSKLLSSRVRIADALVKMDGKRLSPDQLPASRKQIKRNRRQVVVRAQKKLRGELSGLASTKGAPGSKALDALAQRYAKTVVSMGRYSSYAGVVGPLKEIQRLEKMVALGHAKPHQRQFLTSYQKHYASLFKAASDAAIRSIQSAVRAERLNTPKKTDKSRYMDFREGRRSGLGLREGGGMM